MKHILRDIYIFSLDVFGILGSRMKRLHANGPLLRVIVFHDVRDGAWFESVIASIKKTYHVISPDDFHHDRYDPARINVLLTFDDGYDSWVKQVLPVLARNECRGIFFINSGLLDVADDAVRAEAFMRERLRISPKQPLTWEGAQSLLDAGHTIGGHTVSHAHLATSAPEECEREITDDKRKLESKLGIVLQDFAYPFGTRESISAIATAVVKRSGFEYGFTAISNFAPSTNRDQYMIPRMCIEKQQSLSSIHRWMRGGFDIFSKIKHSV